MRNLTGLWRSSQLPNSKSAVRKFLVPNGSSSPEVIRATAAAPAKVEARQHERRVAEMLRCDPDHIPILLGIEALRKPVQPPRLRTAA
jgi:hypothetical protein